MTKRTLNSLVQGSSENAKKLWPFGEKTKSQNLEKVNVLRFNCHIVSSVLAFADSFEGEVSVNNLSSGILEFLRKLLAHCSHKMDTINYSADEVAVDVPIMRKIVVQVEHLKTGWMSHIEFRVSKNGSVEYSHEAEKVL